MLCPGFSGSRPTSSATPAARSDASAPHWPEDRRQLTRATYTYGSDPSQLGELFLPSGRRSFSVCVVVHGGYWRAQHDRSLMTDLCLDLAAHGVAAWNVEYRRVGVGGGWPETFLDVAAAVDLLATLAAPLDLGRVSTVGHSAGGHLAALAALTANEPRYQPGFESADTRVAAAVPYYGVYDVANEAGTKAGRERARFMARVVFRRRFSPDARVFEEASPVAQVGPDAPPFFVIHGRHDTLVPVAEARYFVERLRAVSGAPVVYAELPGTQHAFDVFPSIRTAHVIRAVERFLDYAYAQYIRTREEHR